MSAEVGSVGRLVWVANIVLSNSWSRFRGCIGECSTGSQMAAIDGRETIVLFLPKMLSAVYM